jgi:hypothetical protein
MTSLTNRLLMSHFTSFSFKTKQHRKHAEALQHPDHELCHRTDDVTQHRKHADALQHPDHELCHRTDDVTQHRKHAGVCGFLPKRDEHDCEAIIAARGYLSTSSTGNTNQHQRMQLEQQISNTRGTMNSVTALMTSHTTRGTIVAVGAPLAVPLDQTIGGGFIPEDAGTIGRAGVKPRGCTRSELCSRANGHNGRCNKTFDNGNKYKDEAAAAAAAADDDEEEEDDDEGDEDEDEDEDDGDFDFDEEEEEEDDEIDDDDDDGLVACAKTTPSNCSKQSGYAFRCDSKRKVCTVSAFCSLPAGHRFQCDSLLTPYCSCNEPEGGTVRVFRQKFALEDAIGSHACLLEANMRVIDGIPLGCPLLLPVGTVNCVQTLKANQ